MSGEQDGWTPPEEPPERKNSQVAGNGFDLPLSGKVPGPIVKGIIGVMGQIKEVRKGGWNVSGKYEYVMMADVMAAVQDALVTHKLVISQREIARKVVQKVLIITYSFDVYHEGGDVIYGIGTHSGSCRWEFKAGTVDDKAVAKCYVASLKYFVLNLFKIPPDDNKTERMTDIGEADGQHGDEPPRHTNGDRRERPDTRRQQDPPGERPRELPPRNEPPAGHIDRPFDGPPEGASPSHGSGRSEANLRDQVAVLKRKLEAARSEDDAHDIWRDDMDLLEDIDDDTFTMLDRAYFTQWGIYPPKVTSKRT